MEGAVVCGLIAQKERETLVVDASVREAAILKAESALGEPIRLRHFLDQELFGGSAGLVLGDKI